MGNCMARKAVRVEEQEKKKKKDEAPREEGKSEPECRKASRTWSTKEGTTKLQKKTVRFKEDEEDKEERRKGVVRIRVVVTREELRKILNGESAYSSSSEELLSAIKLGSRSRRIRIDNDDDQSFVSSDNDGDMESRKWRPVLESIPEC